MDFLETKNINKKVSFFVAKVRSKKDKVYYGIFAEVDEEVILLAFINKNVYDNIK